MSTCSSCVAFDWDNTKEGFFGLKYFCHKYHCYRSPDQAACDGFVGDNSCFLTTACVAYKGLTDDCAELTSLRLFRDTYMRSLPDGEEMIQQYYAIAPRIVERINMSGNQEEYYSYIFDKIKACVERIKKEEYNETLLIYKEMTLKLKQELGV